MPLVLISPEHPPRRGGVSDHTARLGRELARHDAVSILTSARLAGAEGEGGAVLHPVIENWQDSAALAEAIARHGKDARIVWQYVPHMYGRGGVNSAVPAAMGRLRERGFRQIVIAHEIAAPLSLWPHRLRYALAHRRQWRSILRHADAIGVSTEAWLEEWKSPKLFLSPSPSSIPWTPVSAEHGAAWRRTAGLPENCLLLVFFGTISDAKQWGWVARAWEHLNASGQPAALAVLGASPERPASSAPASLFLPLGYAAPEEVSRVLQAADILTLPFIDGVSERRTSFMAGLAHGCAVATTLGPNTGPALRRADFFAAAAADDEPAFRAKVTDLARDPARRAWLGAAGRAAYDQSYDWPCVARRLRERLA